MGVKSNTNQLNESTPTPKKYWTILKPNSEVKWSGFTRKYEMKKKKRKKIYDKNEQTKNSNGL